MPWSIEWVESPAHIELRYSEAVGAPELLAAFQAAMEMAHAKKNWRFLADLTEMTGGHSISNLYGLIDLYEVKKVPHSMSEAILMPMLASTHEEVRFYETASLNRGYQIRVFTRREDALAWLAGRPDWHAQDI